MVLQAVVSLLTIGGRRLGSAASGCAPPRAPRGPATGEQGAPEPGRDLEQVRDAIDAVRALLPILERRMPRELGPLREALSQLQFAYAREAQAARSRGGTRARSARARAARPPAGGSPAGAEPGAGGAPSAQEPQQRRGPGPAESSGRLWVPGR